MMSRLSLPEYAFLTREQQDVCDAVVDGKRGKLPAPLIAWILNPEAARRALSLGELLRFDTTLTFAVTELVIVICARHWAADTVWTAHKIHALNAGVPEEVLADIAARRRPTFADAHWDMAYEVTETLLEQKRLPDDLYNRAVGCFTERGLSELVMVLGYYCLASLTLNTFELGLPGDIATQAEDPLHMAGSTPDAAKPQAQGECDVSD